MSDCHLWCPVRLYRVLPTHKNFASLTNPCLVRETYKNTKIKSCDTLWENILNWAVHIVITVLVPCLEDIIKGRRMWYGDCQALYHISGAVTHWRYANTAKLKNAEMNFIQFQFVYHKYNMGCAGIEFRHLRLRVSFTSAPNGRKPAVESTSFKREIPDVMCVRTWSTANPFSGL